MSTKRAIVLSRKSKFYPEPVLCGVFQYEDGSASSAEQRIEYWKDNFLRKFPEFKDAEFTQEYTDIL